MKVTPKVSYRFDNGIHVINFVEGQPREVSDAVAEQLPNEYFVFGGDATKPEPPTPTAAKELSLDDAVYAAVVEVYENGDPKLFDAAGRPKVAEIKKRVPKRYQSKVDGRLRDAAVDVYLANEGA